MQEKSRVTMKWTISPGDYLNGYEDALFTCLQARVENGKIVITKELTSLLDPRNEQLQTQKRVTNFLLTVSLKRKQRAPSLISSGLEVDSGKTRSHYLFAGSGSYVFSGMDANLIHIKNGDQLESDPKKVRNAELIDLYQLINYYDSDQYASKMLESYRNALEHDEKVLIYIYEIRGSLTKCFGNKINAISKLKLDENQWNCFGNLSNDPSVKQGRHFSEVSEKSRDMTDEERKFSLSFSKTMIESYLRYLQQQRGIQTKF